ncbi:hypothetical protein AALO_G00122210 [Alosa alosa]|uniref:Deoxyribonuclease-2-alpha n=1 Tax=Alosa alosa TaxID=278164 RepID=A0AAV6GPE6_9TELE|nr:hypothetical protein AALO_G00122210 [Alosa alosa]
MDETTNGWVPGQYTIDDKQSAVAQTLKPLFDNIDTETDTFGYILYNDQPPVPYRTASSSYGHSKAIQLEYIHVNPFNSHIPESFYPELQCVANKGCYPKEAPYYRQLDMTTLAGHKFVSYAKYGRLHDDLFSAVLDKHMGGDFYAKSWGRLRHPLPSNCSVPNIVYNVEQVQLPTTEPFSITVDHSKWSVTVDESSRPWTCIADMNREVSQESRGGGAVCTDNPAVWSAFSSIVFSYEPCPN